MSDNFIVSITHPETLRVRCRRCGSKLAEPQSNPRSAFCCRGCHRNFYEAHCMACETRMQRTGAYQRLCGRRRCKAEYAALKRHGMLGKFMAESAPQTGFWGEVPSDDSLASETPIFEGLPAAPTPDRGYRIVAGPLSEADLRLATIGAAAVIKQSERTNRALRNEAPGAKFKRSHAPLNLIGGYKFANVPEIDGVGAKHPADAVPAFAESQTA
jgi:hypothetical protein